MKEIYKEHLRTAEKLTADAEKLNFLTSVLRSVLQSVVVTSFEVINAFAPNDEIDLKGYFNRFEKPSDGLPLEILDSVVPFLRNYTNKQFLNGWFENKKLSVQIRKWVEFRNLMQAHGVIDEKTCSHWSKQTSELVKLCLQVFDSAIPNLNDSDNLQLGADFQNLKLKTPLAYNKQAIVISGISARKGVWKLKGQVLSLENAELFTKDLPDDSVFVNPDQHSVDSFEITEIETDTNEYIFLENIPVRQTSTFEGRALEIEALTDWLSDHDSRMCLIYGDGGYGKTTLVLEFLNNFKEGKVEAEKPLPEMISYHTAKKTRYTADGIKHYRSVSTAMEESIREIVRHFLGPLGKDWYGLDPRQLVDKAVGVLSTHSYTRDDILLIIDNTETLATATHEVDELGAFFKLLSRKIGRLIITSRRREHIGAEPIRIEGLSEQEGVSLMKRLAEEYNARPVSQAGEGRLRKVCKQLTNKPLLIEAFVKHCAHSGKGIDASLENIFKKTNDELLEFLYEDAWLRMNEAQKEVFLVLVNISCPIEQHSVSKACQEIGVQHAEFQLSLDETYFCSVVDYGTGYSLSIVELAHRFFESKFKKLSDTEQHKLKEYAENVDLHAVERERIESEYRADRVASAFRTEEAKAAKIFADQGKVKDAIEMFKIAIEADPVNSALYDRFAWLLFNKSADFTYAEEIAKKAIELDSKNGDAIVNLALICYRQGNIDLGDQYIDKAENISRSKAFCLLRKAIARYHKAIRLEDIKEAIELLEDAQEKLELGSKLKSEGDRYEPKNHQEISKYKELTKYKLRSFRASATKMAKKI